jgi:predicted nucleic-acid-binding Zn-ribbon protein
VKTTGTCPKCASRELIRIPGSTGAYGTGNNIFTGKTIFSTVNVTRFLCSTCGYSEEWVESPEDIEKVRKKYGGFKGAG